jgi:hypothetical protein
MHKAEEKKAAVLQTEITTRYPEAVDHRGSLLVDNIKSH